MKVLVATDGSKYGKWAMEWVSQLPLAQAPTVTVLHVVDVGALRAPFVVQPVVVGTERYIKAEIARMEAHAKKTKKEAVELMKSLHLSGRVVTERGAVAPTVIKHAKRGVQLVALGSRGLDALDRFMLGSVSTYAIHHLSCSVLIVKEAPRPLRQVVLAIDGSAPSKKAVQFLLRSMRPWEDVPDQEPVTVTVVHVMPFLKYPELREAGKAMVEQCANQLARVGYIVEQTPKLGNPADEILNVAQKRKADLIVTGAKGLGAVGRFLLGSVSTRVVQHANCSVLVTR
ncbi:MAG TPA: universal stress protein [Nitrospira sp.]|nr:universal stress protein [Nitrospira sp.]